MAVFSIIVLGCCATAVALAYCYRRDARTTGRRDSDGGGAVYSTSGDGATGGHCGDGGGSGGGCGDGGGGGE